MGEHRSDVVQIEDDDSSSDKSGDKAGDSSASANAADKSTVAGEDAESVRNVTEAWLESSERKILMQELEAAKEKPPATSTYAKWKPPPLYLQMWVLWLRRMQAVLNNREATFAPVIIFLVLYTIIATYVAQSFFFFFFFFFFVNQPTNQMTGMDGMEWNGMEWLNAVVSGEWATVRMTSRTEYRSFSS